MSIRFKDKQKMKKLHKSGLENVTQLTRTNSQSSIPKSIIKIDKEKTETNLQG